MSETISPSSVKKPGPLRLLDEVFGREIRAEKKRLLLGYLFAFIAAVCFLFSPFFTQKLLDRALPDKDGNLALACLGLALLSAVLYMVFNMVKTHFCAAAAENIFLGLRTRLLATILRKPMAFFSRFEKGDLVTRLSNDVENLAGTLYEKVLITSTFVAVLIVNYVFMIAWHWRLGLIVTAVLPLYVLFLRIVTPRLIRSTAAARHKLSVQNDVMLDIIAGFREVRLFQQVIPEVKRFQRPAADFTRRNIRAVMTADLTLIGSEGLGNIMALVPLAVGTFFILRGDPTITLGVLVAYDFYVVYSMYVLFYVIAGIAALFREEPLILRLREILDYPEEPPGEMISPEKTPETTRLEFRRVTFGYDPAAPVIRDFNLTIEPGEKIALIGPSGSGKTTLMNLLTRQFRPDAGEIRLGEDVVQNYPLPLFLLHFAYVPQQPHLFKISIKDNISFGWYDSPMDKIVACAKTVRIHDVIERLPHGYDTLFGLKGMNLSRGQKQRIVLARALIRDPGIIILDEFTSSLDRETENEILADILRIFERQTIVCVTHSPAVAAAFPRVVEMSPTR